MREPARIEAQIETTERWIAALKRRIAHGEEMLGALRNELAHVSSDTPHAPDKRVLTPDA